MVHKNSQGEPSKNDTPRKTTEPTKTEKGKNEPPDRSTK